MGFFLTQEDVRRQVKVWYGIDLPTGRAAAIATSLAALRASMIDLRADEPAPSFDAAEPSDFVAALRRSE